MTCTTATLTVAPEPLAALAQPWAELARALPAPLPFDSPAWHTAWWSAFGDGRTPVYLALRGDGALAGVVPLMLDGDRLALAGDAEICDYTALPAAAPHPPPLAEVFAAIDPLPWRTFHIWGLPEGSPALPAALAWATERGYRAEIDFEAVCPRVPLPDSWDAYLAGLSKKDRHELKRKLRRFEESGASVALRVLCTPDEVAAALPAFFHLHRISRHDKAEFMTAQMEAFFQQMTVTLAAERLTRLYLVEVDGAPAAALIAFVSGDELLLYNSGYDPAFAPFSLGIVSKAIALRAAVADGFRGFDFLRGAEPYKYDMGAQDRIVRQIWITRDV